MRVYLKMHVTIFDFILHRYNIEPFFFSSSLNWIPSRYEEEVRAKKGDRKYFITTQQGPVDLSFSDVTITLTFLKSLDDSQRGRRHDSTLSIPGSVSSTIGSEERTILGRYFLRRAYLHLLKPS